MSTNGLPTVGLDNDRVPPTSAALLSRPGIARIVEKSLHEKEIEPAIKLVPDLPEMGDALKPQVLVKADRGIIRRVYAADHDMLPETESQRK